MTKKQTKVTFELREGSFVNQTKVQAYGECLWKLSQKKLLEPRAVVDEARPESSPLHDHFEWDDIKAGEAHRRQQARLLIRSIEFKIEEHEPAKLSFLHVEMVNSKGEKQQGYANRLQIRESTDLREQIVSNAKARLIRWRNDYEDYRKDFGSVFEAIDSSLFDDAA